MSISTVMGRRNRRACGVVSWFLLGLLNNMPYLIMLASAKFMSEGGTALVYICNTVPGLLVKLSAPYWFDHVSYRVRLGGASACMALAFVTTAFFSKKQEGSGKHRSTSTAFFLGQLGGVALVSLQIGLGEASLLALAGKMDTDAAASESACRSSNSSRNYGHNQQAVEDRDEQDNSFLSRRHNSNDSTKRPSASYCLLSFSSGTGLAGPMGYLWKVALTEWLGWSVAEMLALGVVLAVLYWSVFLFAIQEDYYHEACSYNCIEVDSTCAAVPDSIAAGDEQEMVFLGGKHEGLGTVRSSEDSAFIDDAAIATNLSLVPIEPTLGFAPSNDRSSTEVPTLPSAVSTMTFRERFALVRSLWPYIVPLFTVYAAEYTCQAGAWTAIGFPTAQSVDARAHFYVQSNWLYQIGSFLSRSSGAFCLVRLPGLWLMPALQIVNVVFFSSTATRHGQFYRQGILLGGSFYTGLLGGAVYVHGYKRIVADMPPEYTEFALSTTCVAEALGVLVADVTGLFLQSCLYSWNDIPGAFVECPL